MRSPACAVVTGAAHGIGRAIAGELATAGWAVALLDRDEDVLAEAEGIRAEGRVANGWVIDVTDEVALGLAYGEITEQLGAIEAVIANAAIVDRITPAERITSEAWRREIDINLTGAFLSVQSALEGMRQRGYGRVVVISSTSAVDGLAGQAAYTASKHGVVGLMRGFAKLLGPHSIRVNTIHPTAVETPMIVNEAFASFVGDSEAMSALTTRVLPVNMIQPGDVSDAILWLVSDAAKNVTGVTLPVDAGVTCP